MSMMTGGTDGARLDLPGVTEMSWHPPVLVLQPSQEPWFRSTGLQLPEVQDSN
ncbi:hypothetical protein V7S43_005383 [Phytophthora oleae]|uniref:Uncharacterized protein n=1 Tax=Phytophthora oleae TaxID=2107226 RepID=A0ABD3FU91_9STRA